MERGHPKGWRPSLTAVDARSVVPVEDDLGGIVLYLSGEPAYYVLNGEWFPAVPSPRAGTGVVVAPTIPGSDESPGEQPSPGETAPAVRPPPVS